MKQVINLIRKPLVLTALAIVVTVAISFVAITYLILPKFESYQSLVQSNVEDEEHLSLLTRNVASFERLDKEEIAAYALIVKNFIPDRNDMLRFLALNEIVAASSGVKVSGIQLVVKKIKKPVTQPVQTPTGGSKQQSGAGGGLIGKVYAQTTPTPTPTKETNYSLKISIGGGFENIEAYLANLKKTDRLLGIAGITITSDGGTGTGAIVTVELALGDANVNVTPEDSIVLTAKDKEFLEELASSVIFTAGPATNSLGRPNPFK